MDRNYINMTKVVNRDQKLDTYGRGKRPKINENMIRALRKNLNEASLYRFIKQACDNIYDINNCIIPIFEMVRDVNATDSRKKSMIEFLKLNALPKIYADNVNTVYQFLSSEEIPNSEILDDSFRDLSVIDRILKNNKTLKNRFDFDKVIQNNSTGSTEDTIEELCGFIDTYTLSKEAKYNIALENIQYSLYKNAIKDLDQDTIVECITNYFLNNDSVITDTEYRGIKKVLENNLTISESCMDKVGYLFEKSHISYADRIDKLAKDCDDPKITKLITSVKKVDTEKKASAYIESAIKYTNQLSTSQKDAKNLLISIHMIPLLGKVSKSFVVSELKIIEMKYKKKNEIEDQEFIDCINALFEDEEELESNACFAENYINLESDKFSDQYKDPSIVDLLESENFADSKDVKKILDEFKADQHKSVGRFKSCLLRIYQKSPENIIDETPNILSTIRIAFIIGVSVIPMVGPALALIIAFVDRMISMNINEKQASKLITSLEAERKIIQDKLDKGKGNKDDLQKYIKCLDKCIDKVDHYRYTITDDEIEGRDSSSDDFDLDDFSLESKIYTDLTILNTIMEAKEDQELHNKINQLLRSALSEDTVLFGDILTLLEEANDIFDTSAIIEHYKPMKYINLSIHETSAFTNGYDKLMRYESLAPEIENLKENEISSKYYIEYCALEAAKEMVNESFNLNTLKLIIQNFKKKVKDLSTKEKAMWQSLDATMSGFMNAIERSMTSDRREAIIKGSIIPSFSKCLKIGMTVGGAALIDPIFGVITALGIYATSKKLNDRERQLIYDEIETELKVVDKQIQLADNDGNMKQYRMLLQYQKKLERERQRIKYGLKVHGRNIPSSSAGRRDDD